MSTYSTDTELAEEPDQYETSVFVSGSSIARTVRLDMVTAMGLDQDFYMTPDYARKLAAALVRQAEYAER